MDTPAHAVLNLVLLGREGAPARTMPVFAGAVLPDLPIVGFYVYERAIRSMPERWIWSTGYYDHRWQAVFDLFHSLPLIVAGLLLALRFGVPRFALAFASMGLHALADLLLHHDDAHRHFFPLSNWRFASPVSYWDPRHFGHLVAPLEGIAVLAGCALLARRFRSTRSRGVVACLAAMYVVYLSYALWMWVGPP